MPPSWPELPKCSPSQWGSPNIHPEHLPLPHFHVQSITKSCQIPVKSLWDQLVSLHLDYHHPSPRSHQLLAGLLPWRPPDWLISWNVVCTPLSRHIHPCLKCNLVWPFPPWPGLLPLLELFSGAQHLIWTARCAFQISGHAFFFFTLYL